tara:strand:+ start:15079 stop:15768 length:690 start_codon:yes stop_codon:yes gene_type:complete
MSKTIVANFKMNGSSEFIKNWIFEFKQNHKSKNNIILAIPHIYLSEFNGFDLNVAAQNVSSKKDGPYTSQISAKMLQDTQIKYCIIGHSESRKYLNESNAEIMEKFNELIQYEITPIVCIGEPQEVRTNNDTIGYLKSQVSSFKSFRRKIIFAYEPIWAIGTGEHAENDDINEVVDFLRSEFDQEIEILYGGSINVENCDDLHEKTDINGLLVGGASLNPKEFAKIAAL